MGHHGVCSLLLCFFVYVTFADVKRVPLLHDIFNRDTEKVEQPVGSGDSMQYCASPYRYQRRASRPVVVGDPEQGGVVVGGDYPVVRQSMLTSRRWTPKRASNNRWPW